MMRSIPSLMRLVPLWFSNISNVDHFFAIIKTQESLKIFPISLKYKMSLINTDCGCVCKITKITFNVF